MKRALIIGARGQDGTLLADALRARGIDYGGLSRWYSPRRLLMSFTSRPIIILRKTPIFRAPPTYGNLAWRRRSWA